jgi:hypothetical protein
VVSETDGSSPSIDSRAAREMVVLPAPDGADRINIVPRRGGRSDSIIQTI